MYRNNPDRRSSTITAVFVTTIVVTLCIGLPLAWVGVDVITCISSGVVATALLLYAWRWLNENQ